MTAISVWISKESSVLNDIGNQILLLEEVLVCKVIYIIYSCFIIIGRYFKFSAKLEWFGFELPFSDEINE